MKNNNSGLTLIETVIALSLVVILTTAFAGAMTTGLKSENQMNNRKEAVSFASEIIDNLKIRKENDNNLLSKIIKEKEYSKTTGQIQFSDISGEFSNQSNFYTPKIKYKKEAGTNNLLELSVEVNWTDSGKDFNEKIVTLMAVDFNE
ncbi:MAG: type IV pilus modification PilV family protein [bacterium]